MQTIEPRTGKEVVGSTIRLPRNLRDETKIAAIRAGRSFNAHVVLILREKLAEEADAN